MNFGPFTKPITKVYKHSTAHIRFRQVAIPGSRTCHPRAAPAAPQGPTKARNAEMKIDPAGIWPPETSAGTCAAETSIAVGAV